MKKYKKQILISAVFVLVIFIIMLVTFNSNSKYKKANNSSDDSIENMEFTSEKKCTALVIDMDNDKKELQLIDVSSKTQSIYYYDEKTDMRDKYNKVLASSRLEKGSIVDIGYSQATGLLDFVHINKKAWEYSDINDFKIGNNGESFSFNNNKYKLDENYVVVSNNKKIYINDVGEEDILTVRGIDKYVLAIIVTTGHGTIKLSNFDEYIGGEFTIDNRLTYDVSKELSIEAQEGEHYVEINNGQKVASTTFILNRDEDYIIDLKKCDVVENKYGVVKFNIEPEGARLYINGRLYSYNNSFKMSYGTYSINVECTGYEVYSGSITVNKKSKTVTIKLEQSEQEENNTESTVKPSPSILLPTANVVILRTPAPTSTPLIQSTPIPTSSSASNQSTSTPSSTISK